MQDPKENSSWYLTRQGRIRLEQQQDEMHASLLHSWEWSRPDFKDVMDYLHSYEYKIRNGEYLSDTPGKEVWRVPLPKGLGDYEIILKQYDVTMQPLARRIYKSLAFNEAMNLVAFPTIGVPVAELLACSEQRHAGFLREAVLITKCIPNSLDGSVLTPTGILRDNTALRMEFCRKAMEQIARAHRCGCFHSAFHAHKLLFDKDCPRDKLELVWIDLANCHFVHRYPMKLVIPTDLATLFVDLRMDTEQIRELCEYYLTCNSECGFTVDSLWYAMVKLKH